MFKLRVVVAFIHAFINDCSYVYATRAQSLNESVRHRIFINVQTNLRCDRLKKCNFGGFQGGIPPTFGGDRQANRKQNRYDSVGSSIENSAAIATEAAFC